jgi:hypothetical protein
MNRGRLSTREACLKRVISPADGSGRAAALSGRGRWRSTSRCNDASQYSAGCDKQRSPNCVGENVSPPLAWSGVPEGVERQPAFRLGDAVRTRNIHPVTHTRLPRFARDKPGVIVLLHAAHVYPDAVALGQGENPQPLYTVEFRARDLWGEGANPRDTVRIDLWEDYLEPAG